MTVLPIWCLQMFDWNLNFGRFDTHSGDQVWCRSSRDRSIWKSANMFLFCSLLTRMACLSLTVFSYLAGSKTFLQIHSLVSDAIPIWQSAKKFSQKRDTYELTFVARFSFLRQPGISPCTNLVLAVLDLHFSSCQIFYKTSSEIRKYTSLACSSWISSFVANCSVNDWQ